MRAIEPQVERDVARQLEAVVGLPARPVVEDGVAVGVLPGRGVEAEAVRGDHARRQLPVVDQRAEPRRRAVQRRLVARTSPRSGCACRSPTGRVHRGVERIRRRREDAEAGEVVDERRARAPSTGDTTAGTTVPRREPLGQRPPPGRRSAARRSTTRRRCCRSADPGGSAWTSSRRPSGSVAGRRQVVVERQRQVAAPCCPDRSPTAPGCRPAPARAS